VLFPFKCGLASKAGLRHLSWNNSGGSTTNICHGISLLQKSYNLLQDYIIHIRVITKVGSKNYRLKCYKIFISLK
jgi:hypothetical protein